MAGEPASPAVVDASVLIAHLNREEGRADRSRELLEDAEGGQIQLWAPAVILVEVVRSSREVDRSEPEARANLEPFLDSAWLHIVLRTGPDERKEWRSRLEIIARATRCVRVLDGGRWRLGPHGLRRLRGGSVRRDYVEDGSGGAQGAVGVVLERVWEVCRVAARYRPCGQPVHLILVRLRQQPRRQEAHEPQHVGVRGNSTPFAMSSALTAFSAACCARTATHRWDVPSAARRCATSRSSVA